MLRISLSIWAVLGFSLLLKGQINESFVDGEIYLNPTWRGDTAKFEVTTSYELHQNAPSQAGSAHLSTSSSSFSEASWMFDIRITFNPSSNNHAIAYLIADHHHPDSVENGIRIEMGRSSDGIKLIESFEQQDSTLSFQSQWLNHSQSDISLRVVHDSLHWWTVELWDTTWNLLDSFHYNPIKFGAMPSFASQDSTYFILKTKYTSTRSDRFWFDNIVVEGIPLKDERAPVLIAALPAPNQHLILTWTEEIRELLPSQILLDSTHQPTQVYHRADKTFLQFDFKSLPGQVHSLAIQNVSDTSDNYTRVETSFRWLPPPSDGHGITITEFMPDPTPTHGLPACEYIELYNNSSVPHLLSDFLIGDASSETQLPSIVLPAHGFRVIHSGCFDSSNLFVAIDSWPSLNNQGDTIRLLDTSRLELDRVPYSSSEGGVAWELINPNQKCFSQSNWRLSNDAQGGSPGSFNTAWDESADDTPPLIQAVEPLASNTFLIHLDEPCIEQSPWPSLPLSIDSYSWVTNQTLSIKTDTLLSEAITIPLLFVDCQGNKRNTSATLNYGRRPQDSDMLIASYCFDCDTNQLVLYNASQSWVRMEGLQVTFGSDSSTLHGPSLAPNEKRSIREADEGSLIDRWPTYKDEEYCWLLFDAEWVDVVPLVSGANQRQRLDLPCLGLSNWFSSPPLSDSIKPESIYRIDDIVEVVWNSRVRHVLEPSTSHDSLFTTLFSSATSKQITLETCQGDTQTINLELTPQRPKVMFTEIMYDTDGDEYIELWVRSGPINLRDYKLLMVGVDTATYSIEESNLMVADGAMILLTDDPLLVGCGAVRLNLAPSSLPNTGRTLLIQDASDLTLDSLTYHDSLHHPLNEITKNKSLERIAPLRGARWTTAVELAHFGTPGCENSHWGAWPIAERGDKINLAYAEWSPNNDGYRDYPIVQYQNLAPYSSIHTTLSDFQGHVIAQQSGATIAQGSGLLELSEFSDLQISANPIVLTVALYEREQLVEQRRFAMYLRFD